MWGRNECRRAVETGCGRRGATEQLGGIGPPEGRTYVRREGISPAQATIELARGRGTPRSSDPTVPSPVRSDPTLHEVLDQIERDVQFVGGVVVRGSDAQHATAVL